MFFNNRSITRRSRFNQTLLTVIMLVSMLAGNVGMASAAPEFAPGGLGIVSAFPNGSGEAITSQIEITFDQPILPETFAGFINGIPMVPTQIVMESGDTIVRVDPGELEYAKTYSVVVAGTVSAAVEGVTLGDDYTFAFTTMGNPTSKAPTTNIQVPSSVEAGNMVTVSGSASGFIWERDAGNPLTLTHWTESGVVTGDSPMLHPTALYFPEGMDGYKFWLYYTPYPPAEDENPVLMRSNDGINFNSDSIQNPLFTRGIQPPYDGQNLADPEAYRVGNTWMLFYEQEALPGLVQPEWMGSGGNIGLALSSDGKTWQPYGGLYDPSITPSGFPENGNPVVKPPSPTSNAYRSGEMAVIFKDGVYHMWRTVMDGGLFISHDTASDPRGPWTLQNDKIDMGSYEYGPHPDVVYDAERNLYLMLYLIPNGTNVGQLGLYTSSSPAGPWTLHPINPIFSVQGGSWEGSRLYRSSMVKVDGQWYMYYSGDTTGSARIGLAKEVPGVRKVEVSTSGGSTWQAAVVNPDGTWTYSWTPALAGSYNLQARVVDDFMQGSPTAVNVPVSGGPLPAGQAPILVIKDSGFSSNPYNGYLTEILKAEGLTEYQQVELGSLMGDTAPLAFLNQFSVVLLAQSTVNASALQVLQDYVSGGGNLIAMRPDPSIADLFGLSYVAARAEQNLQFFSIDGATEAGSGIVRGSLQYHGAADNYTLNGASALSYLWNNLTTPSTNPAVTLMNVGNGSAVAFTFDLAKSIVMTRQGNPAWKDTEGDTLGGYRPMDMFVRTDGTWWLSGDRTRIPQADEEQRFLANLVLTLSNKPLPRMWYLPGEHNSVLVSTGDAEAVGGTALEPVMNDIAVYGGKYTSYLQEAGIAATTPEVEAGWRAAGNEVGPHVYGGGPDTCAALSPAYAQIASNILSKFGHVARTARSHTIDWCGWSDMAEIEANNGTEMDTNYYHYNNMLLPFGDNANGYFTGSGLPQRFMNEQGTVLPIYQATTQFPDEWFADNGKTADQATTIIKDLINAAENGYYSAFVANIHHVRYDGADSITHTLANNIWAYAQSQDVPLWSAEMLLDFVKARDGSQFNNLTFNSGTLDFDFVPGAARQDLTVMIPANHLGSNLLSLKLDDATQPYNTVTVKGLDYARFTAPAAGGHVTAAYGADTISPVISGAQANEISDIAATITWQTDEAASSRVEIGTDPANLNQFATIAGNVTSHIVPMSGLNPTTTYHYRVVSSDRSGNSTTSDVYTFTTGLPRWVETTTAEFSDGTLNGTALSTLGNGAVVLGAGSAGGDEFEGTVLNTTTWLARDLFGGTPVYSVSGGEATTSSGTYIRTNQTYFQKTLEATVTLRSGPNAHFGWANTVNAGDDGIADPNWIIFTASNGWISARTRLNDGQGTAEEINTPLSGVALDVPHLFKIVWDTDNSVHFWVDGVEKTTHTRSFTEPFRVYITSNSGQSTSADWVHILGVNNSNGDYVSSAFDSQQASNFESLTWTGDTPTGTAAAFETRTSDDGSTWADWQPVSSGGDIGSLSGQFIQYRAVLSSSNTALTPRIDEVTVTYQVAGADTTSPVVNSVTPVNLASGVSVATNITINFSEPIDTTTFSASINGTGAFSTTFQNGNRVAVLNPDVDFDPDSLISVQISGSVEDRAGNALGSVYEWSFTTSEQSTGWVETSAEDFGDGVADNILVTNVGDGELGLVPNFDDHFSGSALGAEWVSGVWGGGAYSPTVNNSLMTQNIPNTYVHSVKTFEIGTSLEGRVKFEKGAGTNAGYMYFGLAGTGLVPWALFGTGYTGDQVYISTYNARTGDPATVGLGNLFGAWHDYKITWKSDRVEYYVDGVLRHTEMVSISGPLYIHTSEGGLAPADASIVIDWVRINQYSTVQQTTNEFSDDFSGSVLNWTSLGNPQFGATNADFHLDSGKLVHGPTGTSYHPAVPRNVGAVSNFEFEVDADSPDGFWAVAWRIQDNGNYYFAQSYGGTLRVYRVNSWTFTQLGNGFVAPVVVAGTTQHIRLVGEGSTFTIYVDGGLVATVSDSTYSTGKVGVVGYGGWVTNFDNAVLRASVITLVPGGSGEYTSNSHDFGAVQVWNGLSWIGQNPTATSVKFSTRSSSDNSTWSDWANVDSSGTIASPSNRYLQYRAGLSSTDLNSGPVVESVTVNSGVQPKVDMVVTNSAPNHISLDAPLHYNLVVTNKRVTTATGVSLEDTLPVEVEFTAASAGCSYVSLSHKVVCDLGSIGVSDTKTVTVDVHVLNSAIGPLSNSVTVYANQPEANTLDNTAVKITSINNQPVAVNDSYSTDAGTTLTVVAPGVLGNDTDINSDPLTAIKVSNTNHGSLSFNLDGSFSYTPDLGYTGDDSFTYMTFDGEVDSNIATVTVSIIPVTPPEPLPSSFYGYIQIYDNSPIPGDVLKVFLPGGGSIPIKTAVITSDGTALIYNLDVPADDAVTSGIEGGSEGQILTFKIGDRIVATGVWHGGTSVSLNIHPPQALPGGPYSGNVGSPISFSSSSNDWGTDASTYEWDWNNDGTYDEIGKDLSHTLSAFGSYTVGLKVTDARGGVGTATVSVTVNKIPVTVTATNGQSKVFGAVDPTFTYTSDLEVTFTGALSRDAGADVGTYAIDQGTLSAGTNYSINFVPANFSITPKGITVTADAGQSKVFGAVDPTFTYTSDPEVTFTGALSRATGADVGAYAIEIGTLSAGGNYSITFVSANFNITPKGITVTADTGQSKVYGAADPTFTYTSSDLGVAITGALSRATGADVGAYAIEIGTLSAGGNYSINFVPANFSITPKGITVTATNGQNKVFGAVDPTFTYTSDPVVTFTGALSRAAGADVGAYAIEIGTLSAGGNYSITFVPANFSIAPKGITVTADAGQSKVFENADTTFTYTSSESGVIFTGALSRVAGENVGVYAIEQGTLSAGTNYSINFVPANFSITPKGITVTTDLGQSKVFGAADPTFTYTSSDLGVAITGALSRVSGADVGAYAIEIGTLSAGADYSITFVPANFNITPKGITVTADVGQSKVFGAVDPTYTYISSESGVIFSGALSRAAGADVGDYAIGIGTLTAGGNYSINFVPANFSITPKGITVTTDLGQSKVYGEVDPTFTYTSDPDVTFTGALSRAAGTDVGTYAIEIGTLSAGGNYSITFVSKDFTITPATATVNLSNLSHIYDGNVKSAMVTTNPSGLAVSVVYSPTNPTDAGSYSVVATVTDPNYSGTESGLLVISMATHNISLVEGWNLVSFNLHPLYTDPGLVLTSITGNYDLVYAWDAASTGWLKYDNILASPDSLTSLDEKMGFWIHMTSADILEITGTVPTTSLITLQGSGDGWNLVSYPSAGNLALPSALTDHGVSGTNFSLVYTYHASDTADMWKLYDQNRPALFNDLTGLTPGWGYWVKMSANSDWDVE